MKNSIDHHTNSIVRHAISIDKKLKYRVVTDKHEKITDLDLITVDVYEGYRKLGRFKLKDIKIKFR